MHLKKLDSQPSRSIWAFIIPSLIMVVAIWLPFGFSLTGLIEEWGVLGLFTQNGLFFVVTPTTPFALHAMRPLTIFPHAIAYLLDPNSFNYWHVLLMLALLVKGSTTSILCWQATGSRFWAIIAGLLILVYPADTMQLSMRALHINWGLSLLLLASTLFVAACHCAKMIRAYSLGIISGVLLWAALGMYEAALPLVVFPFFIMYVREGFRSSLSRWNSHKGLIALWCLSIILYLAYAAIVTSKVLSYQEAMLSKRSVLEVILSTYPKLFNPGMLRSIVGGWFDAFRITFTEIGLPGYLYIFLALAFLFIVTWILLKKENHETEKKEAIPSAVIARLAIIGLLLCVLGYAPYIFSGSHLAISQRTYLFAAPGAALFWTAVFIQLAQWKKIIACFSATFLIMLGLGTQLFQFHHYVQIAETQRLLLRNIIENFDGQLDKKTLIILDKSNQLSYTWMFLIPNLTGALSYLYGHPINNVEVCQLPDHEWRRYQPGRPSSCIEKKEKWVFKGPAEGQTGIAPIIKTISKKDAIILTIKKDGSIDKKESSSHKNYLIAKDESLNQRYQNILTPRTWTAHFDSFWRHQNLDSYRWSFGNWWSMELPIRGSGWYEAEWQPGKFYHHASAWKSREDATLHFDLAPRHSEYLIRGKFAAIVNEEIRQSIKLQINKHRVSYRWVNSNEFEAKIPFSALITGINTLGIYSLLDPTYGLSVKLAWFEVSPV